MAIAGEAATSNIAEVEEIALWTTHPDPEPEPTPSRVFDSDMPNRTASTLRGHHGLEGLPGPGRRCDVARRGGRRIRRAWDRCPYDVGPQRTRVAASTVTPGAKRGEWWGALDRNRNAGFVVVCIAKGRRPLGRRLAPLLRETSSATDSDETAPSPIATAPVYCGTRHQILFRSSSARSMSYRFGLACGTQ